MADECPNIEENLENCNCTYGSCPRKGRCCECMRYHWRMGELPACFFPPEAEKTYDRSIQNFIKVHGKR